MPLLKKLSLLFLFLLAFLAFPYPINAWGGDVHHYLCPDFLQSRDCGIADSLEFKKAYPSGFVWHLCLDNKPDCPPRLLAKYYVKKYFLEGKKDEKLLLGAAHLIQDSACPDHWFPMREFFKGKIFVPFAPSWVSKTEGEVSLGLSSKQPNWSVVRRYKGKTIVLNQTYMDNLKSEIAQFIANEPAEDLATLEKQIQAKTFWNKVRAYREWTLLGILLVLPFLAYYARQWYTKKSGKTDLILLVLIWPFFILVYLLGYLY